MRAWVRCIRTPLAEPPGPFVLQHNHSGAIGTQNMKKTLTVLAVMAIAAAAYAEISTTKLGEWAFASSESTVAPDPFKVDDVTAVSFSTLSRAGGLEVNGSSANFNSKGWNYTDETAKPHVELTITVASGFKVDNAGLKANAQSSNTGPGTMEWIMGNQTLTTWNMTSSATNYDVPMGNLAAGAYTLKQQSANLTTVGGGTLGAGGTSRLTTLQFNGDVSKTSAVPEPATMSLLGLGALAMALRRKLRK